MAVLTTEHVFAGGLEQVFGGLKDFPQYPQFLPGVSEIAVLPKKKAGSICQVHYTVKLVKTFHYTLDMFEEAPKRLWWSLDSSNLMKKSDGSWTLHDLGEGRTQALYALDVTFSGLVPQKIVDQVTKATLPALMSGMQRLIDSHKVN